MGGTVNCSRARRATCHAKDLLIALNEITRDWPKDLRHWPLSPEALAHRLLRLAPVLRAQGIEVRKRPRTAKRGHGGKSGVRAPSFHCSWKGRGDDTGSRADGLKAGDGWMTVLFSSVIRPRPLFRRVYTMAVTE